MLLLNYQFNQIKMETKPHHLSAEGRALRAKEAEEAAKGNAAATIETTNETAPETLQTAPPIEASVPISQVEAMLEKMLAEKLQNATPQAPVFQPQYQKYTKEEHDIDDIPELRGWEMKDREYELCDGTKPISLSIAKQHTKETPLQYTNKDKQTVHSLRYATNQPSFFSEKQSKEPGSVLVTDIIFSYGRLKVPANNINLQKFLAIHPHKNIVFKEYDPLAKSRKVISDKKLKLKASGLVFTVGEITNRAIAGLEFPDYVESWDPELLEERVLAFSESQPQKYIDYTEDPTIKMKGVIKSALASGDLIYSNYRFLNKKREMIIEVAKNQNEMDELVLYFESGTGRALYEYYVNLLN